jgi:hypothetical protein
VCQIAILVGVVLCVAVWRVGVGGSIGGTYTARRARKDHWTQYVDKVGSESRNRIANTVAERARVRPLGPSCHAHGRRARVV